MAARITNEERENIKTMLRSGYTRDQIHDATGRSVPMIQKICNEMKETENFDPYHKGGIISKDIPVATVDNDKKEVVNNEVIQDIPKKITSLEVQRKVVRFAGKFTGFNYIVGSDQEELVIRDDAQEFKVSFDKLEKFVTELLDIATETTTIKKLMNI